MSLQRTAGITGMVFVLIGVLGFVPGLTHPGFVSASGHHTEAALFGVFKVSLLDNVFHVAFGVAGLLLAGTFTKAWTYLIGGGLCYLFVSLYGSALDRRGAMSAMPINGANDWLHLGLATAMIALGAIFAHTRAVTGSTVDDRRATPGTLAP